MIRVLHVITTLGLGGAERMLTSLATAGPDGRVAHAVASLVPGGAFAAVLRGAGVPVMELPVGPWPPNPWPVAGLARAIRRMRPHVVQGWLYHGDLAAAVALALSGRRRASRLVWTLQCSRLDTHQYRRQLRVVIRACAAVSRHVDVVVSNSEAGLASHLQLGYRAPRVRVIHPGIDTERFRPDPEAARRARHELGLPAATEVVAHVARRDPMKDHACLRRAMEQLPGVHVLAIGTGTETLAPAPALHRLGHREDVERLLAACDVSVSSSAFGEGFPNSLAESMAVGVPAVATDVGDTRALLGDTGYVVSPGAPDQLAAAIRRLLAESPEARRARGAAARERVVAHFGRGRMVERFARLYTELRGARSGARGRGADLGEDDGAS
jgi:glycosyltransferase involved in cell wall biosynthesis